MSLKNPDKREREWCDAITQLGCICCRIEGFGFVQAAVHHILKGGKRVGHLATLPLCPSHHQHAPKGSGQVARHEGKTRFEAQYGHEADLLDMCQRLINKRRVS